MRLRAAATLIVLALIGAGPPQASFNDIEDEVMCVTCNVPLNVAESPQADQQREQIRALVADGLTKQQILDNLVAQYGDDNILAAPKAEGVNIAAYAVPIGTGVLLLAGLALALPRWRRRSPAVAFGAGPGGDAAASLSAADARRLDEDLARYET